MTKWILLAGVGFAASVAPALAADVPPSLQRSWYGNGRWSVAGFMFANGNKDCVLANTQPMSSGNQLLCRTNLAIDWVNVALGRSGPPGVTPS
jgi:hypothetical protein